MPRGLGVLGEGDSVQERAEGSTSQRRRFGMLLLIEHGEIGLV